MSMSFEPLEAEKAEIRKLVEGGIRLDHLASHVYRRMCVLIGGGRESVATSLILTALLAVVRSHQSPLVKPCPVAWRWRYVFEGEADRTWNHVASGDAIPRVTDPRLTTTIEVQSLYAAPPGAPEAQEPERDEQLAWETWQAALVIQGGNVPDRDRFASWWRHFYGDPDDVPTGSAEHWWGDCARCHRPYSDPGFPDLIISNEAWRQISPTGGDGGLLCPSCIIGALTELGITTEATFRSGPLAGQVVHFGGSMLPEEYADSKLPSAEDVRGILCNDYVLSTPTASEPRATIAEQDAAWDAKEKGKTYYHGG